MPAILSEITLNMLPAFVVILLNCHFLTLLKKQPLNVSMKISYGIF